jgi:hypothetical protein
MALLSAWLSAARAPQGLGFGFGGRISGGRLAGIAAVLSKAILQLLQPCRKRRDRLLLGLQLLLLVGKPGEQVFYKLDYGIGALLVDC